MGNWYITDEGYSATADQTHKAEWCSALCDCGECCGDCDKCQVYKE